MNFLKSLGNWTLIILSILISVFWVIVFTHKQDADITLINISTAVINASIVSIFVGSAIFLGWKELHTKRNGIMFGVFFSAFLSGLFSIVLYVNNVFKLPAISFVMFFAIFFSIGFTIIPTKYRGLLIFFGKVLEGRELDEGIAWKLPFAQMRLFDMTRQTLNLTKRGDDIPMFPNGTRLKELEIIFMYHLKSGELHKLVYLGNDWHHEVEIVINDSIPPALITLSNSITAYELKEKFYNSYSIALLSYLEMFKLALSHGAFFCSTEDFPNLTKDSFWKKRAYNTFDTDFLASRGYFPKIITTKIGKELLYLNAQGEEPSKKILKELSLQKPKDKIDYVIKNDLSICIFDEYQKDVLASNNISIYNLKGIFDKALELGLVPISLNILNIQATDDIKAQAHRNELENVQRKAELQSVKTHSLLVEELKKQGIDTDLATILAAKMQGMDNVSSHEIKKHKFEGDTDFSKLLTGLSTLFPNKQGNEDE